MKLATRGILGIGLTIALYCPANAEAFGPYTVRAQEVKSGSDKGKTTHASLRFQVPNDRFVDETKIKWVSQQGTGRNQSCSISYEREPLRLKTGNFEVDVSNVKAVTVTAHAETGSGVTNIGKSAWKECTIAGEMQEFK
ncbi:hypothetical protein AB4099_34915 [Bosea sp. 2KB_26]|uniref:hypothetical protein n=1 Tax=Bosea sp. 2KB_26 TaxID=3237475 RepID=UPI003F8DA092